jgi:NADH-quinone oxidoreductase subunit J
VTLYGGLFYLVAIVILVSTLLAITRRQVVHAVVYLIVSFIGTAMLFYLLGAPFLAALEVIIYAGAIMVLFLFTVMTVRVESSEGVKGETLRQWMPAIVLSVISFLVGAVLIVEAPGSRADLNASMAAPTVFGQFVFKSYWFPVEIVSFLLLIGLVGALYLGRQESKKEGKGSEEKT